MNLEGQGYNQKKAEKKHTHRQKKKGGGIQAMFILDLETGGRRGKIGQLEKLQPRERPRLEGDGGKSTPWTKQNARDPMRPMAMLIKKSSHRHM